MIGVMVIVGGGSQMSKTNNPTSVFMNNPGIISSLSGYNPEAYTSIRAKQFGSWRIGNFAINIDKPITTEQIHMVENLLGWDFCKGPDYEEITNEAIDTETVEKITVDILQNMCVSVLPTYFKNVSTSTLFESEKIPSCEAWEFLKLCSHRKATDLGDLVPYPLFKDWPAHTFADHIETSVRYIWKTIGGRYDNHR